MGQGFECRRRSTVIERGTGSSSYGSFTSLLMEAPGLCSTPQAPVLDTIVTGALGRRMNEHVVLFIIEGEALLAAALSFDRSSLSVPFVIVAVPIGKAHALTSGRYGVPSDKLTAMGGCRADDSFIHPIHVVCHAEVPYSYCGVGLGQRVVGSVSCLSSSTSSPTSSRVISSMAGEASGLRPGAGRAIRWQVAHP